MQKCKKSTASKTIPDQTTFVHQNLWSRNPAMHDVVLKYCDMLAQFNFTLLPIQDMFCRQMFLFKVHLSGSSGQRLDSLQQQQDHIGLQERIFSGGRGAAPVLRDHQQRHKLWRKRRFSPRVVDSQIHYAYMFACGSYYCAPFGAKYRTNRVK